MPIDLAPGFAQPNPQDYYLSATAGGRFARTTNALPGFECVGGLLYNYITASGIGSSSTNIRDTFAPSMLQQDIISPTRNYTGFLTGTYDTDFFGDGQLYGELLVTRRKSQQNGQRQFIIDYASTRRNNANTANIANPLLPTVLQGRGTIRVFADYGIYDTRQTQDFVKVSGGFRGDLPFLSTWRYDALRRARAGRTVSTASSRS